jgi:phage repressor protein C with HTH and peptisase S24 domain
MGGIKAENLFALARATGFSPQWLAEGIGKPQSSSQAVDEFSAIPPFDAKSGDGYLVFDRSWIKGLCADEVSVKYYLVKSSNMAPTIAAHDLVLIDESDKTPIDRQVYLIIKPDGTPVIKRLIQTISNDWLITNGDDNGRYLPTEQLDDQQVKALDVAGKVIWRGGKI